MHEDQCNEPFKGDNTPPGIRAGKRPYQPPGRFNLAHCYTKGGPLQDDEDNENSPSGEG
jgi:hypothetical protein